MEGVNGAVRAEEEEEIELGRYPWCGAPFPGWEECDMREECLSGRAERCEYIEREYEYYGERSIYWAFW